MNNEYNRSSPHIPFLPIMFRTFLGLGPTYLGDLNWQPVSTVSLGRGIHPSNPMMRIVYSPYFQKIYKFPPISAKFIHFPLFPQNLRYFASPHFDHDAFMHFTRTGRPCHWAVFVCWIFMTLFSDLRPQLPSIVLLLVLHFRMTFLCYSQHGANCVYSLSQDSLSFLMDLHTGIFSDDMSNSRDTSQLVR